MEYWNLYDNDLKKTSKVISSVDQIPEGYYHLALEIWIINSKKQVLLLKNAIDYSKRYPDSWCCLGGNVCVDEEINDSIRRIINDKIGIKLLFNEENIVISKPIKRDPYKYAYITCIIFDNVDTNKIKFIDESSSAVKCVDKAELNKMCNNGEIAYYLLDRINSEIINYL